MRSSVDAADFYKAMTALMDIPAKSPVKVLQEIKVEFTADHCTLSATDFGTWLSVTIPASGDDFAFVFWNSAGVQKVCRYFTGQLELELSGQRKSQIITMRCGDKGGKFPVYEADTNIFLKRLMIYRRCCIMKMVMRNEKIHFHA